MNNLLKQSTAQDVMLGVFVDDSDGLTEETALTIAASDIRLSKDGANFAAKNSGGATHNENGWYKASLDATDTATLGELVIYVNVSGALPVFHRFTVVSANVYDSLVAGSDNLEVDTTLIEGTDATDQINQEADTALADYDALKLSDVADSAAVNDASATTTSFVTDLTETTDDHYNGSAIRFTSGNLAGQVRRVSDYNGTSKTLTLGSALTEAPADGDAFILIGRIE